MNEEQKSAGKNREGWIVPRRERFSYYIGSGSHFTMHTFMSAFLVTYLLMIGVDPIASALVLVILRSWDAINDTLFGYLIDRIHFKPGKGRLSRWLFSGRYLPWFRIATFVIPISMIITFTVNTNAPMELRILQYAIGYLLYDTSYTISFAPWGCMLTSMTNDVDERNHLQSYSILGQALGLMPVLFLGTFLIAGAFGYSSTAILFSIYGFLLAIPALFSIKERNVSAPTEASKDKHSIRDMIRFLKTSREFLFFEFGQIMWGILATGGTLGLFVAYYLFGDAYIAVLFALFTFLPTIFLLPFFPKIFKRVNKITALQIACLLCMISGLSMYFIRPEGLMAIPILFYCLLIMNGTATVFIAIGSALLLPDLAEIAKYRTKTDRVGIIWSIHSTVTKMVSSIVASLGLVILAVYGWVSVTAGSFEELAALNDIGIGLQTPLALQGLWDVTYLFPSIGFGLAAIVFLLVKVDRKSIETMIRVNNGEITHEEAEIMLEEQGEKEGMNRENDIEGTETTERAIEDDQSNDQTNDGMP